jgi:hypothetical protein
MLGTRQVRRFHGCLDGPTLAHWASFCVGFVESAAAPARTEAALAAFVWPPLADGLGALRHAQEHATLAELVERTRSHVGEDTIKHLLRTATGETRMWPSEHGAECEVGEAARRPGTPSTPEVG